MFCPCSDVRSSGCRGMEARGRRDASGHQDARSCGRGMSGVMAAGEVAVAMMRGVAAIGMREGGIVATAVRGGAAVGMPVVADPRARELVLCTRMRPPGLLCDWTLGLWEGRCS